MTVKTETLIVAGVALAVIYLAYQAKKAAEDTANNAIDAVKKVIPLVDPTSDKNLAYQGASALTRWLTGSEGDLGTIMFDYANKGQPAPGGGVTNYTAEQQAADLKATQQLEAGFHGM